MQNWIIDKKITDAFEHKLVMECPCCGKQFDYYIAKDYLFCPECSEELYCPELFIFTIECFVPVWNTYRAITFVGDTTQLMWVVGDLKEQGCMQVKVVQTLRYL